MAVPSSPIPVSPLQDAPGIDSARLGPALLVAASLIAAIRTSGWPKERLCASAEWEAELDHSIALAHRIFSHLDQKSPFLFRSMP